MPKQTEYTKISPTLTVQFNRTQLVVDTPSMIEIYEYIPVTITGNTVATTPDGGRRDVEVKQELGALQDEPLTWRQIHALLKQHAPPLAAVLKELAIAAIDEDPEEE